MTHKNNCPYEDMSEKPCWNCNWHNPDMNTCDLFGNFNESVNHSSHQSYEDKLKKYEEERQKLLNLSKEKLVDLILKKATYFESWKG